MTEVLTNDTEITGQEDNPQVTEPQAQVQTTPAQGTPAKDDYNPEWYKQDGRFGKMWKSEQDIIKSYYNLEKQYKPMADQFKAYNSTFKELGIDYKQLPEVYKEYQSLKDPSNPLNQKASYLDSWLQDPVFSPKVEGFFKELEMAKLQEMYPGMNREQIQKQMELEEKVNRFETAQQKQEDEKYIQNFSTQLTQSVEKNQKLAEQVGFNYTPDIHKEVMAMVAKHDADNGYPITPYQAFLDLYGDKIELARQQKLEADILKRQSAKSNSGTPARTGKPIATQGSLKDKFAQILNTK